MQPFRAETQRHLEYIDHTVSNYGADEGPPEADYNAASKCFVELINTAFLDDKIRRPSPALRIFEADLKLVLPLFIRAARMMLEGRPPRIRRT